MLMSFDLTNERVAPVRSLPAGSKFGIGCLRKVYGRPCVAARTYDFLKGTETEEMWLLERGGWLGRERWHRRFYVTGQHHEPVFTCGHHSVVRTFSYVETTEPLRVDNDKKKAAGKTTFLGQMLTSIFNGLSIMTATID
ncbi:hypothetical protein E2562_037193 [Oryza meyeriana var. granulata]|uniref:F-box associated domain-containing protein n=1 Tax=Oryza meyeriana var. granulata TaxID=110450 RepID=A0A6G1DAV4_9ORYZ|nr:hypothetical protein E2562_037193 [Oryza meyeriana var. granulata]